jgi:hypothetical protein
MLQILLKQKTYVNKYYKNFKREFQKDLLNFIDWKKFRTINNFFQPFSKIIFFIKGDEISIDRTLFIIDILIKYF